MRTVLVALFLVILLPTALAANTHHILKNQFLEVLIDCETGSIAQIHDLRTPDSLQVFDASDVVLQVAAGDLRPALFSISANDKNSLTLRSCRYQDDPGELYLGTQIRYRLIDNRLAVDYCFEALERMELTEGLDIHLSSSAWDSIAIYNHYCSEDPVVLCRDTEPRYFGLDQLYELHSDARTLHMLIPNPYHSSVTITPSAMNSFQFRWHVLVASDPFKAVDPKGPQLASLLSPGTRLYRQIELIITHDDDPPSNPPEAVAYLSPFPNGWEQVIAMTFDDIPFGSFVVPKSGHDPDTPRQQYIIRLLEDHPRMKMGWIILPDAIFSEDLIRNPDYPPGKWWRAHGVGRVLTDSSPEYLQWLCNIERDSVVYGYEDRVHLGNHGYHHAPEMQFGANWEFQCYDPVCNDSTFATIVSEYHSMGLTGKSLKWIRFPGFKFTRATLDALIKSGFIFFDYWGIEGRLPWMLFYSEHGRAWGVGSQWHGDAPQTYELMDSLFLSRGKFCHTAGHPSQWFDFAGDREAAYQQIHEIFQQAEADYPNLGYMFPDEVGDYATQTYDLRDVASEMFSNALVITFTGRAPPGLTVVAQWPDSVPCAGGVTIDGRDISEAEVRDRRLFIELPVLEDGLHIVHAPFRTGTAIDLHSPPSHVTLSQNYPNPFSTMTAFSFTLPGRSPVALSIYNIEGKLIRTLVSDACGSGVNKALWDGTDFRGNPVSSGVYFYRLQAGGEVLTRKMVLVR
jgi:hypothetical protein